MIKLGSVQDSRVVHMKINNKKLIERGTEMFTEKSGITDCGKAKALLTT
jgi:N-acetylmuramic acid 6-phosphate (MurNAc-6-P) etherase